MGKSTIEVGGIKKELSINNRQKPEKNQYHNS